MALTDREKLLVRCLEQHQINLETVKIIIMMLLDNPAGQNLLIQYLTNTRELTENELLLKTEQIADKIKG